MVCSLSASVRAPLLSDGGSVEDMQATFARVVSLSGSLGEEQICNIQKKVK